jgi:hypothetical protein
MGRGRPAGSGPRRRRVARREEVAPWRRTLLRPFGTSGGKVVAPTGVETPGSIPAALRAFGVLRKAPRRRPGERPSQAYLSLCRLSLAAAKEEGRRSQRFLFCLCDPYLGSAILILSQRFFRRLSDSYLGPAILILCQRCLSWLCDAYFGPAILILSLRSLSRASDSYFASAILILALRSLFWASDSYFGSAKNRSGIAALAPEGDDTRRGGGG